jgi:predicted DNA-binding transcriptional regulator YafY
MGTKSIYERFIWFDSKVRLKRYPNATRLAEEFEISGKTAQRDIEFMRDRLNCPLLYDQAKRGYCYEDETFSLPLMYLSSAELSSLIIARKLLQDISGGYMADDIGSAVSKITSIIKKHTAKPDVIDEAMSFHLIEYAPAPEDVFRTVLEACLRKKTLLFIYSSPSRAEATERRVDPYHLLNYMGTWHVVGHCHTRQGIRDFRINRIQRPKILGESFSLRHNFCFRDYFRSSFGIYKGKHAQQVVLRLSPEKARWIGDQIWHRDQKATVLDDGSMELSFPVADFSEIAREVLKHGAGVEVLRPESLRQAIKTEAKKILKIY